MPKADFATVSNLACGQWPEILTGLGLDSAYLKKKHGPCPVCAGKDRFRFDDKDGRGTFFCNNCSSGDGFVLLEKYHRWDRKESLARVAAWLGLNKGEAITPEERQKAKQRVESERRKQEQARITELKENALEAVKRWEVAQEPPFDHAYLEVKKITAEGIRFLDGELLIPLLDRTGKICNLQRIYQGAAASNGTKSFEKRFLGPGVTGCFHLIGKPLKRLYIAEGYATAVSIYLATGDAVAVAFNAGNLLPVAKVLKGSFQEVDIVLAADNDASNKQNTGLTKAKAAAKAVGGVFVCPAFEASIDYGTFQPSDFNDMAYGEGLQSVKEFIETQLKNVVGKSKKQSKKTENSQQSGDRKGPFFVSDKGVYFSPPDGSDSSWICSRLDVLARTRDENSGNWGLLVSFTDFDDNKKQWNIPSETLAGDGGGEVIRMLLNMGLNIGSGPKAKQRLLEYLLCSDLKDRNRLVYKLGWHDNAFLWPDGSVSGKPVEPIVFHSTSRVLNPAAVQGTVDQWRDNVAGLCSGNGRLIFSVSTGFASPLLHLIGMQSGGFHLFGDSSEGKTTALNVAASVYGKPEDEKRGHYIQRWRTTDNALEDISKSYSGFLLPLDEIKQCDPRIIGETVYMLGNNTGKARGTDTGGSRAIANWRLLFLSTGEKTLAEHMAEGGKRVEAGAEMRMIAVPSNAGAGLGIFNTLHDYADGSALATKLKRVTHEYYGAAGKEFLDRVTVDISKVTSYIRQYIINYKARNLPHGVSGQVVRVADYFALVACAGELATEWGITGWGKGDCEKAALACFDAWLNYRGGTSNHEDIAAMQQVQSWFEMNGEARFSWVQRGEEDRVPVTVNRCGYREINSLDEFNFYVFPEQFKREICKGFKHINVAKLLAEKGALIPGNGNRLQNQKRLPRSDKPSRVYMLNSKVLDLVGQVDQDGLSQGKDS